MSIKARLKSCVPLLDDLLRYNPWSQGALSLIHWLIAALTPPHRASWLSRACAAARCAPSAVWMEAIEGWMLRRLDALTPETLWSWQPQEKSVVEVNKAAILKLPSIDEKGVVFVSFESQWEKLLALGPKRLAAFASEYDLVVAPTWSPPHSVTNLVFPRLFPGALPCTISNLLDLQIFPRLHSSYLPVELFASSWVHPELYQPRARIDRDIDLLMVANFGRYKRHHVLFAALARIPREKRPRVVLVGQPHGSRTADVLLQEMDDYGVRDCITLRSRISDAEVVDILCRSKAALITSLREGSCVAVVESMMADTPLALLKGAHIGSSAFLNEQTGRWLDEDKLHIQLPQFIAEAGSFSPRRWLLENGVECHASTQTLNQHLRVRAAASGIPWTTDLAEHHWRPDPILLDANFRAKAGAEAARLRQTLGLHIPITGYEA